MKTSIAAIAITLVCLVSFVAADHQMVNDMKATDVNPTKRGKANLAISMAPTYIRSTMSPSVALTAATTTST
ncbi:unnamed protein product [Peronospora farinosa]|uniref:Uncharacterized protein n=1 Tax=Peronospora farinosa TaxID=134698 RepID=A0AAV0UQQ8_9STRA|nr:unnamed protein product [Peronospora farinosa]